jgi:hypothetical protein
MEHWLYHASGMQVVYSTRHGVFKLHEAKRTADYVTLQLLTALHCIAGIQTYV